MNQKMMSMTPKQQGFLALLLLIAGILLCFFPQEMLLTAGRLLGIVVIAFGAYCIYLYFKDRKKGNPLMLAAGAVGAGLGLLMLFQPASLLSLLPIILSLGVIFFSMMQMHEAFKYKEAGSSKWTWTLTFSILMLALGFFLLLKPMEAFVSVFKLGGILLMLESVYLFWQVFTNGQFD